MEIMNRILELLQYNHLTQTDICNYLGIKTNVFTTWKKRGTDPPTKYIIQICDFLNVTPEYLLTGTERSNNTNISNSNIVDHSHGTITINSGSASKETKTETENISKQTVINETTKELIEVFESLPTRERVKLLNMVYEFEEQYHKSNPPIPPKEETPTFNAQSQWRIAARTIDGTYESRPATPEEIEKLKLLEDAPEPEY